MRLELCSKMKTKADGKTKYRTFWTHMMIVVKGEEDKGKQNKSVNVSFRKDVKCADGIDDRKLKRGIIYGKWDAPYVWEVTIGEDGKKHYPTIWVRAIDKYIEKDIGHDQSDFVVSTDESETEEMPFEENN